MGNPHNVEIYAQRVWVERRFVARVMCGPQKEEEEEKEWRQGRSTLRETAVSKWPFQESGVLFNRKMLCVAAAGEGKVVRFAGRVTISEHERQKYINTRQTERNVRSPREGDLPDSISRDEALSSISAFTHWCTFWCEVIWGEGGFVNCECLNAKKRDFIELGNSKIFGSRR